MASDSPPWARYHLDSRGRTAVLVHTSIRAGQSRSHIIIQTCTPTKYSVFMWWTACAWSLCSNSVSLLRLSYDVPVFLGPLHSTWECHWMSMTSSSRTLWQTWYDCAHVCVCVCLCGGGGGIRTCVEAIHCNRRRKCWVIMIKINCQVMMVADNAGARDRAQTVAQLW